METKEIAKDYLSIFDLMYNTSIRKLEGYSVYSDESMNMRKVRIKGTTKDDLRYKFFVIGGVEIPDGCNLNELEKLYIDDDFPKNEFKYKYFSYDSDFMKTIKSNRINKFFKFILENNIYIHINVLNYWYWAICDIVDSIDNVDFNYEMNIERKMGMYEALMAYYDETYDVFIKYDFPSIEHGKEKEFLFEILNILNKSIKEKYRKGDEEYSSIIDLIELINNKINVVDDLAFIQDETPLEICNSLVNSYIQVAYFFKENGMIFDNETKIEEDLYNISPDLIKELNCKFIDSKSSIAIQMSDVISGFTARLFEFVSDETRVDNFFDNLRTGNIAFSNISLYKEILDKSVIFYKFNYSLQASIHQNASVCRFLNIMDTFKNL